MDCLWNLTRHCSADTPIEERVLRMAGPSEVKNQVGSLMLVDLRTIANSARVETETLQMCSSSNGILPASASGSVLFAHTIHAYAPVVARQTTCDKNAESCERTCKREIRKIQGKFRYPALHREAQHNKLTNTLSMA